MLGTGGRKEWGLGFGADRAVGREDQRLQKVDGRDGDRTKVTYLMRQNGAPKNGNLYVCLFYHHFLQKERRRNCYFLQKGEKAIYKSMRVRSPLSLCFLST